MIRNSLISFIVLFSVFNVGCSPKQETTGCDPIKFDCTPVSSVSEVVESAEVNPEVPLVEDNSNVVEEVPLHENIDTQEVVNTLPQIKYQLFSRPVTTSGVTIYNTYLKLISMEDDIKIAELSINKGRCSYRHFSGNSHLGYGSSVEYFIGCNQDNILQIEVLLADGRSVAVNP